MTALRFPLLFDCVVNYRGAFSRLGKLHHLSRVEDRRANYQRITLFFTCAVLSPKLTVAKTILMYGRKAELLESRRMVLESRGFRVSPIYDLARIDEALGSKSFNLLVFCHTLTNKDCGRMLAVASTRWPLMKTLILTAGASGCHSKMMTEVFDILDGPSRLILTVSRMTDTDNSLPIQTC